MAATVVPVAPTPAAAAVAPVAPVVTVPDNEVPLGVMEQEEEPEELINQPIENELMQIEDEDVPLASTDLAASGRHWVIHIIELILAAIMGGTYVETRRQKKELLELKKRLEDEER